MINTIINSEAFLIVISGVFIFTVQNLISQIWISPNIEFKKCTAKIEALITRYAFLYAFKYGTNNGIMDNEIEYFRKELKNLVLEMLVTHSILFEYEKWWCKKWNKINILKARVEMLTLSAVIGTSADYNKQTRAEEAIENIPKYLNLSQIKYKMADIL